MIVPAHWSLLQVLLQVQLPLPASSAAVTPPSPASAPAQPPVAASTAAPSAAEILVHGNSVAERARRSAYPVEVVSLAPEQQKSADLGEVLARSSSLRVQREGGLGSQGRYSLTGLSGDRVRFLIDGLPLEYSSYQLGVGNVPIDQIDRVEVYQGVVPVRFGADALGGAVHLVSDENVRQNRARASYQYGSFDTHRLAAGLRRYLPGAGAFVRGAAFFDSAANDYPIDVKSIVRDDGPEQDIRVRRFHDGYRGAGVTLAGGVVDKPWANRLTLQGFVSDASRHLQHNAGMSVPYGEVSYGRSATGLSVRHAKRFSEQLRFDGVVAYSARNTRLRDVSRCRYDWYGRCFLELPLRGEINSIPSDTRSDEHVALARLELSARPSEGHTLRLALAPTWVTRTGQDRALPAGSHDPLRARRSSFNGVLGAEYEASLGALSLVSFVKGYGYFARSEERLPTGELHRPRANDVLFGAGDSLRLLLGERVYAKASYEYAARLPSAEERFGDGALIAENLNLRPERSENFNLSFNVDELVTRFGAVRVRVNGSLRRVDNLVLLLNTGTYYEYSNVLRARALGLDAGLGFTSTNQLLGLDAYVGYQDVRNTSASGPGALFRGDRVPNWPWLQAGVNARSRVQRVFAERDVLELSWNSRYVHEFLLGWESAAKTAQRLRTPSQFLHSLALLYSAPQGAATLSSSFEIYNLTDRHAYDFYGVQRPGRSFYLKFSIDHQ